jgi:hypothetical protein
VTVAVYLSSAMLTPGWYWLDVDGAPHGYGADDVPSVAAPALPPHYPRELLPPGPDHGRAVKVTESCACGSSVKVDGDPRGAARIRRPVARRPCV